MGLKTLFLETFTWWNNQTLSTKFFTLFRGKLVGKDPNGNQFYINKKNNNQMCKMILGCHFLRQQAVPEKIYF